jgi:hypothetical protein
MLSSNLILGFTSDRFPKGFHTKILHAFFVSTILGKFPAHRSVPDLTAPTTVASIK